MAETNDTAADQDAPAEAPGAVDIAELDPMTAELAERGFGIADNFPANHRLRAEALIAAGKSSDPANHITDEFIAETATRLEAERKEAEEADRQARADTPTMSWTRDRLVEHATGIGLTIEGDANKSAILDAITAATPAE